MSEITVNELTFASSSGLCDIFVRKLAPADAGDVRAVFQITHGMAEHTERYLDFARFMAEHGFAVYMQDHLGHGKSMRNADEAGFFGEKNGDITLVEDTKLLTDLAKEQNPGKKLILFGHSMGSFIARSYLAKYGSLVDAAIICGTSGANPGAGIGRQVAVITAKKNGSHFRSEFINSLAFSSYNKRIKNARTPFDWLTRDEAVVDKYIDDPLCGFLFTAAGYRDLFSLLKGISARSWYANVPYPLPIFLIAGEEDPVGSYGKGVKEVARLLKDTAHTAVSIKLYPGCRHELLNELSKDEVYSDILDFSERIITQ